MNNKVMPLLSDLTNMPIDGFHIDTKNDKIKLNFTENSKEIEEIIFDEVVSFYYLDHENVDECEIISLNNIMYCGTAPEMINIEDGDEMSVSIPNFVLELNTSNVFIEANAITINKETFEVS